MYPSINDSLANQPPMKPVIVEDIGNPYSSNNLARYG